MLTLLKTSPSSVHLHYSQVAVFNNAKPQLLLHSAAGPSKDAHQLSAHPIIIVSLADLPHQTLYIICNANLSQKCDSSFRCRIISYFCRIMRMTCVTSRERSRLPSHGRHRTTSSSLRLSFFQTLSFCLLRSVMLLQKVESSRAVVREDKL